MRADRFWLFAAAATLIVAGKLSGFFKDILITFYLGVSDLTDAYFLASSISSLLYMAVYSAIPILVVPLYSRLRTGPNALQNAEMSAALFFLTAISLAIGLAATVGAEAIVDVFSGGVNQAVRSHSIKYLSIMGWTFVLSCMVAFLNAVQSVNGATLPSYTVPIFNNATFCVGLYALSMPADFDFVLILGVLAWAFLALINGLRCRKVLQFRMPGYGGFVSAKGFAQLLLPALVAFYIEQVNAFVGVYFASEIGPGAISVYGYAGKLNMVFLSIFLVFLTASLFPKIAAISASGDRDALRGYLVACTRAVILASVPVVIYMSTFSQEIVELIFHRGKFVASDVLRVSAVFTVVVASLPFFVVRDLMNRVFFSFSDTLTPVLISIAALTINAALCLATYRWLGLKGVAFAVVAATAGHSAISVVLIKRRIGVDLFPAVGQTIATAAGAGGVAYLTLQYLATNSASAWTVAAGPFVVMYVLVLWVLRNKEVAYVMANIATTLRRRA